MTTFNLNQFTKLKSRHPDAVLLFRCGDFYETYNEDAEIAEDVLGLTLTRKNNVSMAGFPHHALDTYLPKLIRSGHRVAICDQLEAPSPSVKRSISDLPTMINLPDVTKAQYDLICECIRYRAADNDRECQEAISRGGETLYYDNKERDINELKTIFYNLK